MSAWREQTNARRAGILGTLAFHLLVAIVLVGMNISRVGVHEGMEITLAVPPVEEATRRRLEEARQREEDAAAERELARALAVNEEIAERRAPVEREIERYIKEIREELDEAATRDGRHAARKGRQHDADSLDALEARRQRELDSLQSVVHAGESSVSYRLAGRHRVYLPVPVFRCESGGTVVVSIVVNPRGEVVRATVVDASTRADACPREVAVEAATRSRFNADEKAPPRQTGTITYHFVRQ
jgi:TonB family protein